MNSKRKIRNDVVLISLLLSIFATSLLLFAGDRNYALLSELGSRYRGSSEVKAETFVSASIGQFRFSLFGYTSPGAEVFLEGQGIFDTTVANSLGYFSFTNKFSPLSPREACLRVVDTNGRISNPLCLPPFPVKKNVNIGPIVLPPTFSLNQETYAVNDYGVMLGKAVPDSSVKIDVYSDRQAEKISLATRTDNKGNFSMTLPTEHQNTIRTFTQNNFHDIESIKSHTLTFDVMPLWILFIRRLFALFGLLSEYIIPIILFTEILILAYIMAFRDKETHPLAIYIGKILNRLL